MKKTLIIIMMALLGMSQMVAQEEQYEYAPFVREGVKWVCYYHNDGGYRIMDRYFGPGKTYFTLELKGDTVIDGKEYKALHKYGGEEINTVDDTVLMYLREKDRVVNGIVPVGQKYYGLNEFGYGSSLNNDILELIYSGQEFILLDYKDTEDYYLDIFSKDRHGKDIVALDPDYVTYGDKKVLRHKFYDPSGYEYYIIEGVGVDGYYPGYLLDFMRLSSISSPYFLSHIIENGKVIYKGINCDYVAPMDGRLPLLREGVTWVNERVVIDHGVTTRYYYRYELQSEPSENLATRMSCLYHSYDKTNGGEDAMVAELLEDPYWWELYYYTNLPMDKVVEENRNLMNYNGPTAAYSNGGHRFFFFNHHDTYYTMNQYIGSQRKPKILTTDNFIEVEPVEIEGVQCRRYAYVDETGEIQAYVVEGIGFDSRDMGDLLTPFTRKPDPDADYQEWCGLSHVIKDGKIIYKGLRYDAAAVEALQEDRPGDVNGDGIVDISDVTTMIDLVLNGHQLYRAPADMDSDGSVDINDVTNLISIVLGNK